MTATQTIWINGEPADQLSVLDRGLQFGDGLFETLACIEGQIPLLMQHVQRLLRGCDVLRLPRPDVDGWVAELQRTARQLNHGVIKLIYTRGESQRGYQIPTACKPTRIVIASGWPAGVARNATEGMRVRWCRQRLSQQPVLAGLKHLNRLEQVLARAEWNDAAIHEGLMLDQQGCVIEGVSSNLFLLADGKLVTPDLSACGVAGVMRDAVMHVAREHGLPVGIRQVLPAELETAEAVFLTNSLMGMRPVGTLDGRPVSMSPVIETLQLQLLAFLQTA